MIFKVPSNKNHSMIYQKHTKSSYRGGGPKPTPSLSSVLPYRSVRGWDRAQQPGEKGEIYREKREIIPGKMSWHRHLPGTGRAAAGPRGPYPPGCLQGSRSGAGGGRTPCALQSGASTPTAAAAGVSKGRSLAARKNCDANVSTSSACCVAALICFLKEPVFKDIFPSNAGFRQTRVEESTP